MSGLVDLKVTDIRSDLTLAAYGVDQRPQLNILNCTALVSQLEMNLSGGVLPWLVNLFHGPLSTAMKNLIHDQFCLSARTVILDQLNEILRFI